MLRETLKIIISIIILLFSVLSLEVSCTEYYKEKPDFVQTCRINDENFVSCSTKSTQKLLEALIKGVPQFEKEFGPLDPMHVKDIHFKHDNYQLAAITADLSNVKVKGFSKVETKENKVSKKDFSLRTKMFVPKLRIDADYDMKGRVLMMPLGGKGKMFTEMDNLDVIQYTKVRLYEKDGITFNNITKVIVDLNMTNMQSYFTNLFNGSSKELEESTNQFFNENWRDAYEALKPIIVKTVSDILYKMMHKIFDLIPVNFFIEDAPTSQKLYGTKV